MKSTGSLVSEWFGFSLVLIVLLFPFSYQLLAFHTELVRTSFAAPALGLAGSLGFDPVLRDLSSDSIGLYVHVTAVLFVSVPLFGILRRIIPAFHGSGVLLRSFLAWFLALILFKYGMDKLLLKQFPVPEANLLYTPVGNMDKDILFWTSMGSSSLYNFITGGIEVVTALLLLIRKTRPVGLLISTGIFLQILIINLSFDISVKLLSALLLTISVYLAFPWLQKIWTLLVKQKSVYSWTEEFKAPAVPFAVRALLLIIVIAEAFYPYLPTTAQAEIPLQGAYHCSEAQEGEVRRVFIHSEGYLIFQNDHDELADFKAEFNTIQRKILISDYDGQVSEIAYQWDASNETLYLQLAQGGTPVRFKKLDHRSMPLLMDKFHLSVD